MKVNYIKQGDSLKLFKQINENSIDIIVTSPPYNAGHNYDVYDDNVSLEKYELFLQKILLNCYKVLKPDGRICINVPFAIKNKITKKVFFLATMITDLCNDIGFNAFEFICWHKGKTISHFQGNNTAWGSFKSPSCPNFRPLGEAVLVFYKKNRKHVGNRKNIDINKEEFKNWTKNVWYFSETNSNVLFASNTARKKAHPAPFPEELVERLLKLYSYRNDIVLDPFNGTGTTTVVAKRLKRKFIGFELSKKYCKIANERLDDEK